MSMRQLILGAMPPGANPEKYLASGPWCFSGQEDKFPHWETRFEFAPEPLLHPQTRLRAARSAQALAVKMIPAIARLLHANDLPKAYWQVLLAPWIVDMASQIVDRSLRAKAMVEQWGTLPLEVTLASACEFQFADEHDFTLRGSLGILFNHWLFSKLLLDSWPSAWTKKELPLASLAAPAQPKATLKSRCLNLARHLLLRLPFPKIKGLDLRQAIKFSLALARHCRQPDHSLDLEQAFNYEEDLAWAPLPENTLELFSAAIPQSLRKLRHGRLSRQTAKPGLRLASIAAHEDAAYRQRLAIWKAAGNRLAYCQHGANYGQVKMPCAAEVVEYSQDVFFTWGWSAQGDAKGNFMPMPSPLLSRHANAWHGSPKATLLFVGTEMSAFGHRLDSHPTPLQFVSYRQAKARFFSALPSEIRKSSFYRPYFPLPSCLADADWLLPQFPEIELCQGALLPQLLDCSLLVVDHHGTTILEGMAYNTPMLCYWDRRAWPLAPEFEQLVNMLETCGIFHSSPEKAAAKAGEIWPDAQVWWNTPEIQAARLEFCSKQALFNENMEQKWLEALRKL